METQIATTPFGRRPASLAQIATQTRLREAVSAARAPGSNAPAAVNKWHLFRTLAEIRDQLGVSDRALSVLNALLSFHPETALSLGADGWAGDDLVVHPSNRQLSLRAHGMAEVTIRRHLAALVEANLIVRRDSPNGKRYARRDSAGAGAVFGFDLAPLVVRAVEFEAIAEAARRARRDWQVAKERISLRRRDIQKWLAMALDDGLPGDWETLRRRFMGLLQPLRSVRTAAEAARLERDLAELHAAVSKQLGSLSFSRDLDGNDVQSDRHKSNSKTESPIEIEPASKEVGCVVDVDCSGSCDEAAEGDLPLGLVLEACPDLEEWAESGRIPDWASLLATAERVRPMLGVSHDAWLEARRILGVRHAAIALGFILQRSEHSSEAAAAADGRRTVNGSPAVRSAGGYLRSLTEQADAGGLRLGPLLMALIGQRLKQRRRTE